MLNAHVSFSIFMFTSAICFIVLTVYLVKLVMSAKELTDNANVIATSVQKEIEPTLQELKGTIKSINSIAASADEKIQNAQNNVSSVLEVTSCLSGKLKGFATGILKGVVFGLRLFKK